MLPLVFLAVSALFVGGHGQRGETDGGRMLIRNVAVNDQVIVFSYAGDLWKVDRSGGAAERLTEGQDEDDFPVFSRDGQSLAFGRRGADDWDVYVVPVEGGELSRLTYNPEADIPREWSASGDSVIFLSHRDEAGTFRLYEVARDGGEAAVADLREERVETVSQLVEQGLHLVQAQQRRGVAGEGKFVEIQGTAESEPFDARTLRTMLTLARSGCTALLRAQRAALRAATRGRAP